MRLKRLRSTFDGLQLDAMLIGQADNRRYLSGFTGSSGWMLISAERAILATDFRYFEQVGREAPSFELAKIDKKLADLLPGLLVDMGVKRLGFESQHVTMDEHQMWSRAAREVEWVPLKGTVEKLRAIKDEDEIAVLRRSAALTDAALAHLQDVLEPGMKEREAAWEIEAYMRTHGASRVAFDLIVAAGPNGAMPHAKPGERDIRTGEPVVVDIGCVLDGYCSDLTRTFSVGRPDSRYLEVWDVAYRAQEAALARVRPGMSGVEADALARDVIVEAGYGEQFGHGLGHGVGLAVHEGPSASRLSEDTLEAGMSLTIEPGIYIPGEFGVRIEDLVILRETGVEILGGSPKKPVLD